jgi:hypothetical protein
MPPLIQKRTSHSSWQELVASPARASHVVQIYDNDAFLAAGVGLFAAEGVGRGEAVLLTGTSAHLRDIGAALRSRAVDVDAALANGQLVAMEVEDALAAVMVDGMPQHDGFRGVISETLRAARDDARFSGVRWWGEMSPVLYRAGNVRGALATEELAGEAANAHDCVIFCSYLADRFDARAYDGMLCEVCACHSHVIPAEDYVRHRQAVNRAIAEVIGEIRGTMLQSLLSWQGPGCELPSSQALLFWLRDAVPERFHEVLSRARAYQLE